MLALLAILAAAAAIRIYLFGGFVGLDDAEYARFAWRISQGLEAAPDYTGPAVFPLRVGLILPAALFYRLFGLGEWTSVVYPLLLSLAGIGLAYLLAARLFGWRAGLIAAGLASMFPWDIRAATNLLPDMPGAVWAGAGVAVVLLALRSTRERSSLRFLIGVGAGLAFGISWLCKESVVYLVPFCAIWIVLTLREHGRGVLLLWLGVAAGSLAVLLGEMLVYQQLYGDALHRFHEVERNYHQWENSFFTEGSAFGWQAGESYSAALVRRLFVTGPRMILLNPTFLYVPLLALLVSIYAWWRKRRDYLVPSLWLWILVLMFNFGSSSTSGYVPLALFNRYLFPIFLPAIIIVSGFLAESLLSAAGQPGRRTRAAGALVAGVVLWLGGTDLASNLRTPPTWLPEVRAVNAHIPANATLYSDAITLRALEFFRRYPAVDRWIDLSAVAAPDAMPPGSLVLVNPAGIRWLDVNAGMWVAWPVPGPTDRGGYLRGHFYQSPPATWQSVWRQGDVTLYEVGSGSAAPVAVNARR